MPIKFIDDAFVVPKVLVTEHFHLTVLEDSLAALDYEAVMSSQKRLQGMFGLDSDWPKVNMSLQQNIQELKNHQQEFEARQAFAYSVLNLSKTRCLGCVYVDPSPSEDYDCEVYLWVRDDSLALDKVLFETVMQWLNNDWPFARIGFPGRCIE
ncbi:hypothetical protein BCU94_16610 [Shewanella sp. 10N.286.52.C2]|uniref:hypothetical protein n=1 Tax=Shewanella sp. 10N.286.52.C2 TaxID=1880838 RepID=UPI000C85FC56|nr:hypothetical protein [Shewanella sp. 10N.286.52.C2]PMG28562.1 hypothetical protein BCU94_16610 [Shewanella sp. 10N.286.52.C2]